VKQPASTEFPAIAMDEPVVGIHPQAARGFVNMLLSRRQLIVFVMMLVIFTGAAQPITYPDFWWHLKTGQYIVETRTIPHTDIFSTVRFGSEWVTHEWLSEVFIYSVFRTLGYGGLIVVFSIVITGAFWIAYQRCKKRAKHPYVAGFALLLGAFATIPTWDARPQMFSLLFASVFISFLNRHSRGENMLSIWWLAPLMILWLNLHAGFALGLALILITIVGLALDGLLLREDSLANVWRRTRSLCWLLIICLAAVSLNPNGARMYSYPFETLSSDAMMQNIQEWQSPDFHNPLFQALGLLFFVTFSALALSNKRVRPGELLMLAVTGWATLRSRRNVPFFALVAAPLLAEHSWNWITSYRWGQWLTAPENREPGRKSTLKLTLNVLLLVIALTLVVLGVGRAVAKQPVREAQEFPAAAVDFILARRPPQPIFNEYNWGGYLIWRLYPDYRVYIDGRADVYGDRLVEEFVHVHEGKTGWREALDDHGIRTVLVKPDVPLASLLRLDSGWQKVFEDKQAVIFVRR
jgi:hypothetical protein